MIKQFRMYLLSFVIVISGGLNAVFAENVSAAKYKDFYDQKKEEERRETIRETGRLNYKKAREAEEKRQEELAADFAAQNSRKQEEERDEYAEAWMAKQDQLHADGLERARKDYMLSKKDKYKYKIPESEEFDVK